jgi:hypothetical protein
MYNKHHPSWTIDNTPEQIVPAYWQYFIGLYQEELLGLYCNSSNSTRSGASGWKVPISDWSSGEMKLKAIDYLKRF